MNPRRLYKVKATNFIGDEPDQQSPEQEPTRKYYEESRPSKTNRANYPNERAKQIFEISQHEFDLIDETAELMKDILHQSQSLEDLRSFVIR